MDEMTPFTKVSNKHEVLTKEAERVLIAAAQQGNSTAFNTLIKHNYRLIISIAKKFRDKGLGMDDLIQEGTMGFIRSVQKFELERNLKLSTYASQWIRQACGRAIENKSRVIRIPIHILTKITKIKKVYRKYVEDNQDIPTSEEIAALCDMSKDEAEELGRLLQDTMSLNQETGDDPNLTILDYIADDYLESNVEDHVSSSADKEELLRLLDLINTEDREFMLFMYGFMDYEKKSYEQVAEAFDMPVSEVKYKEAKILDGLYDLSTPKDFNSDGIIRGEELVLLTITNFSSMTLDSRFNAVKALKDTDISNLLLTGKQEILLEQLDYIRDVLAHNGIFTQAGKSAMLGTELGG